MNKQFWKKKKILITGHTGFKGSWLSVFLNTIGSQVSGIALNPVGKNNFFNNAKIKKIFKNDIRHDITDLKLLKKSLKKIKPEIIFHLAAQSSVIESFKNPIDTIKSNVLGTASIIEAIKFDKNVKCLIIITTDKVYQNYKTKKIFKEGAMLGGDDVYSGSKASCEIIVNSFRKSFFKNSNCKIATVRAGNCFGGGDWTKDRIVKDALECFTNNKNLTLRMPEATRPWQHVIEPLYGYLLLAEKLSSKKGNLFAKAWNFGPNISQNMKVINLVKLIKTKIKTNSKIVIKRKFKKINKKFSSFESKYLNIDSTNVFRALKWSPSLSIINAVNLTVEWHQTFMKKGNLLELSREQIKDYLRKLRKNYKKL
jgi:CDP-glucose 4,6-dehydratase